MSGLFIVLVAPLTLFLNAAIFQFIAARWLSEDKAKLVSFSVCVGLAFYSFSRGQFLQSRAEIIGIVVAFVLLGIIMFRRRTAHG